VNTLLRTSHLSITSPTELSEPWINGQVQRVVLDAEGEITQTLNRTEQMHRRFGLIATDMVTVSDPVTQQEVTLSGYGLQLAIQAIVAQWLVEDNPGAFIDEQGRVTIVE